MSSRKLILLVLLMVFSATCTSPRKLGEINKGETSFSLSLPTDEEVAEENEVEMMTVSVDTTRSGEPYIMNAIRDDATGEMVATDVISASKVVARFRHVAERFGKIQLEFDISVPGQMMDSKWQLRFRPTMTMMGDTTLLDPLFITGKKYRDAQLRGYERYNAFLRSIVTDSLLLLHAKQLDLFIARNLPETYAMKNDTTFISDSDAVSVFGVSQQAALEHYTRRFLVARNERRKGNLGKMFRRYVKDPIETDGIRLDTVLTGDDGEFIFRYRQLVTSRPGLKRINIALKGEIYDYGKLVGEMPSPEDLVFYVSSLSSLADNNQRFLMNVLERKVYDHTLALIDFAQGKASIDTTLGDNAQELIRIKKCIDDLTSLEEFEPDSIVVTASCSPEGSYRANAELAEKRSKSISSFLNSSFNEQNSWKLIARSIPENWTLLETMVSMDSTMDNKPKASIIDLIRSSGDRDDVERKLSKMGEYQYLRQHIYPRLRTVRLEFYLHRKGMVKDTIHTTVLDTLYMSGVEALRQLDYQRACEILRPYKDYNAAVALVASSYNWSALDILDGLDQNNPKVLYLKTIIHARLGDKKAAIDCYRRSVELDPSMAYRANLDPEVTDIVRRYESTANY